MPAKKIFKEVLAIEAPRPALGLITMKRVADTSSNHKFLAIKEREFPHLFRNPIVQYQKMSKFLDE